MSTKKTDIDYIEASIEELNPEKRDWYYDSFGNRVHKESGNYVVICNDVPPEQLTFLSEDNMGVQLSCSAGDDIVISDADTIWTTWHPPVVEPKKTEDVLTMTTLTEQTDD